MRSAVSKQKTTRTVSKWTNTMDEMEDIKADRDMDIRWMPAKIKGNGMEQREMFVTTQCLD